MKTISPWTLSASFLAAEPELAGKLLEGAERFLLPEGGLLLADHKLRKVPLDNLRLPYPQIVCEFADAAIEGEGRQEWLVFAHQKNGDDQIGLTTWIRSQKMPWTNAGWHVLSGVYCLPQIDPSDPIHFSLASMSSAQKPANFRVSERAACVVLDLINALCCDNVTAERARPAATNSRRAALPSDRYHVLVVDVHDDNEKAEQEFAGQAVRGSGSEKRRPREHLRRGHYRHLKDGRVVWVNECLVAANPQAGKVQTDYRPATVL